MSFISKQTRIKRLLGSKASRDAYVLENIKRMVPFQIRTMREERGWSQAKAGESIGKPQNVVSRLESLSYGKLSLQTLVEVAQGYDVGLLIKFVPFSRLVREYDDLSPAALSAKSVTDKDERAKLEAWKSVVGITSTGYVTSFVSSPKYNDTSRGFFTTALPARRRESLAASNQLQFGFAQTGDTNQSLDNVFSIKTRRPLSQRKVPRRQLPVRYRRTGT